MAEILKPTGLNSRWAMSGDILDPGVTKYENGWEVEIPPRQWFNFIDNRQDEAIAHINQHGISVWDTVTEYQAAKSYVQGSDGNLYRSITTNTNINPVGDGGTNWLLIAAFRLATALEAQGWSSNLVLLSPGRLSDALKGSNQSLTQTGYQKIPGGYIRQWGFVNVAATTGGVVFPVAFPGACTNVQLTDVATSATDVVINTDVPNTTGFTWYSTQNVGGFFWSAEGF